MNYVDQELDFSMYELEGLGQVMMILYLFVIFVSLAVSAVFYILQSVGYYQTAKRRGINHAWLAWMPVGAAWIAGCVSDQYQYVVKGRVCNKRKGMLALSIIALVCCAACYASFISFLWYSMGPESPEFVNLEFIMGTGVTMVICGWVTVGVSLALTIMNYIALYDFFVSCEPKNAALFLILSIIFNITMPIFVFVCRNKDAGMPPRKEPAQAVPQSVTEPWEQTPEA
jgi:hypothetical protein